MHAGVVNVLSTGVLTIPMMLKRGFSKVFAGGVEAAASSGGSIMPPVMGVAAFVFGSAHQRSLFRRDHRGNYSCIGIFFLSFSFGCFSSKKAKYPGDWENHG